VILSRPFDWLTRFTQAKQQPAALEVLPVIQPTLDVSCNWPLELVRERRTGTLAVGSNKFNFGPGADPAFAAYPDTQRHHAIFRWMRIAPGASLLFHVTILDTVTNVEVDRLFTGTTTLAFPFVGVLPDRRMLAHPYVLQLEILAAAGTESFDFRAVRWDRMEFEPLIF